MRVCISKSQLCLLAQLAMLVSHLFFIGIQVPLNLYGIMQQKTTMPSALSQSYKFTCIRGVSGEYLSSFGSLPSCKVASEGAG